MAKTISRAATFWLFILTAAGAAAQVVPFCEGYENDDQGRRVVWWGYSNPGAEVAFEIGDENYISPGNPYQGQPKVFLSGTHRFAFRTFINVDTPSPWRTWTVDSNSVAFTADSPVVGQGFTYQGRLARGGAPLNGAYDLRFSLWRSSAGPELQVGGIIERPATTITNGVFTTRLFFAASEAVYVFNTFEQTLGPTPFDGRPGYWLQIEIRQAGTDSWTTFPREPINPVPWANAATFACLSEAANSVRRPGSGALLVTSVTGATLVGSTGSLIAHDNGLTQSGKLAIGTNTSAPNAMLTVAPGGAGFIHIGDPNLNAGGATSLRMGVTALAAGEAEISAVKSAGSEYGNIILNRFGGRVAIGNISPTFQLQLSQSSAAKPGGGSWADFSDRRLKTNIEPLGDALHRLLALRGVTYEWRDPSAHGDLAGPQIGMIAQEVERVFPEWIGHDPSGYLTLGFRGFEALTVEALRELEASSRLRAEQLEARAAALESENNVLRERLDRIEKMLAN